MNKINYPYQTPVSINNQTYVFPEAIEKRDGNRVWTVEVALAHYLCNDNLINAVELGGGLGLIAMVTEAAIIEKDEITLIETKKTLVMNNKSNRIIADDWSNVNESFDSIIGSEILYPGYNPKSIADFVLRNWTRKGRCLFATSNLIINEEFESMLKVQHTLKEFEGNNYYLWEIDGKNL